MEVTNAYGTGRIPYSVQGNNVTSPVYLFSLGCPTVHAEIVEWASVNAKYVTKDITKANTVIVFGCQRSDVAIYESLLSASCLDTQITSKVILIGGCLHGRFDVTLPSTMYRLFHIPRPEGYKTDSSLVAQNNSPLNPSLFLDTKRSSRHKPVYDAPFSNFTPAAVSGSPPEWQSCLKVRPKSSYLKTNFATSKLMRMRLEGSNSPLLIASDNPDCLQVSRWCNEAIFAEKKLAFSNIEPEVLQSREVEDALRTASRLKFLSAIHIPLYSTDPELLSKLHRSVSRTLRLAKLIDYLRAQGTQVATTVIIGHPEPNLLVGNMADFFDYIHPLVHWNNNWVRTAAEARHMFFSNVLKNDGICGWESNDTRAKHFNLMMMGKKRDYVGA